MAFPATYNINYYKGDTLEFNIYPKKADGTPFFLTDLEDPAYDNVATTTANSGASYAYETAGFWVSTERGPAGIASRHQCFAQIDSSKTFVKCAIRPGDADFFDPDITYVYDIEVRNAGSSSVYSQVHTLLTGTITVTDQITGAS